MFTSRAEYRLTLREDNADLRLTEIGRSLGLVDERRWAAFSTKREAIDRELARLQETVVRPQTAAAEVADRYLKRPLVQPQSLADLLRRPEIVYAHLAEIDAQRVEDPAVSEQVEIQVKYAGYISRQQEEVDRLRRHENMPLPEDLDYDSVGGLSNEIKQKLKALRPETIAHASRVQGVTPAAVSQLLVHLKKRDLLRKQSA